MFFIYLDNFYIFGIIRVEETTKERAGVLVNEIEDSELPPELRMEDYENDYDDEDNDDIEVDDEYEVNRD